MGGPHLSCSHNLCSCCFRGVNSENLNSPAILVLEIETDKFCKFVHALSIIIARLQNSTILWFSEKKKMSVLNFRHLSPSLSLLICSTGILAPHFVYGPQAQSTQGRPGTQQLSSSASTPVWATCPGEGSAQGCTQPCSLSALGTDLPHPTVTPVEPSQPPMDCATLGTQGPLHSMLANMSPHPGPNPWLKLLMGPSQTAVPTGLLHALCGVFQSAARDPSVQLGDVLPDQGACVFSIFVSLHQTLRDPKTHASSG